MAQTATTILHRLGIARTAGSASRPVSVALFDRSAWRDAVVIWLGQRLLLLIVMYIGRTLLLTTWTETNVISSISWERLFTNWLAWDGTNVVGHADLRYG